MAKVTQKQIIEHLDSVIKNVNDEATAYAKRFVQHEKIEDQTRAKDLIGKVEMVKNIRRFVKTGKK
jgi:hypothetical protein